MLRPMESAPTFTPGENREFPVLKNCPDCSGRGWFCENPLAEYNKRYRCCPTCWAAKKHFDEHGTLPDDIAAAMMPNLNSPTSDVG